MTGSTILLKSEKIKLPEELQQKIIEWAHKGSHYNDWKYYFAKIRKNHTTRKAATEGYCIAT